MGVVYEGWDARLNRRVAIKTLWPALAPREEARERFLREARAAAAVSHPNVTQVYDIGSEGGQVYFAMELMDGESLQQILEREGRLPEKRAVDVIRQAARGLQAAEERGIVHRDIKPSNLVYTADGTLKVTDFGLAKQLLTEKDLTLDGQTLGTPKYLSPEQASGAAVDARSDIYSLGATLYEMLTGRPPFDGASPMEVMLKHVREPVTPVQKRNPAVTRSMAALVHRMLSKQPGARPQSYAELLQLLERVERGADVPLATATSTVRVPTVPPVVLSQRESKPSFAGRLFLVTAFGLILLVAAGTVYRATRGGTDGDAAGEPSDRGLPAGIRLLPDPPSTAIRTAPVGPIERIGPPTERAGRAKLEITTANHDITDDGRMLVHGEVRNRGESRARNTKVRISLTDTEGAVITSTEVFLTPTELTVGEQGRFEASFPDPQQDVRIVFELNWIS
jgi:hypothetical protein